MGVRKAFLLSVFFGDGALPNVNARNPNKPGDVCKFDPDSLKLLVEEGRIQLADQNDRFKHATDRSQLLVTVAVALVGFLAALLHGLLKLHVSIRQDLALAFWSLSVLLVLVGLAFGASVITTKAFLSQVDTTQISSWTPPVLQELARDYAKAVRLGEITVADRVTIFRVGTRYTLWGAIFGALAFALSA